MITSGEPLKPATERPAGTHRRDSAATGRSAASEVRQALQLWGGVECTVNRVGERYFDQIERGGHARRIEDLDAIAALGIRTVRYPVVWERVAPDGLDAGADWRWTDERLARLRDLSITPIAGLVHHGSGPRHTHLLDPGFAPGLAAYARAVAERYPWVERYTPVNEPLTTARFTGLYGHWYPHAADALAFARALLNECRATVLAMQAIREVNPRAQLVQTEDLGKTHSTRRLAYQAAFENERRWVTFDLLCGRVLPGHRMWQFLTWLGIPEAELAWFAEHPCPPDVLGVNHYVTSERFLDERRARYPLHTHGGNGRDRYADVEAVRVRAQGVEGPGALLLECWQRYHLPVVVTEAHLSCTREEQLRWLLEVWRGAQAARRAGADVRAVTAWSLLGAYDWNSLLTRTADYYESGAFDLRGPAPRPTALTRLIQELAAGRAPRHPALAEPGWWRRPETRLHYPPVRSAQPRGRLALRQRRFSQDQVRSPKACPEPAEGSEVRSRSAGDFHAGFGTDGRAGTMTVLSIAGRGKAMNVRSRDTQPLAITGSTGTLGRAFARLCDLRGLAYRLTSRQDMDVADRASVEAALDALQPWALVNTAGYVRVDQAEQEPERCFRENAEGPAILAEACARRGIPLVTFSSDLVFDGRKGSPYVESDPAAPLNVYGRSKVLAEQRVLAAHPAALVVRTSAFFGPWDEYNFVTIALSRLANGLSFAATPDQVITPTYVPDLVHATLDLLIDGERGIWHVANGEPLSWLDLARRAAELAGIDASRLESVPAAALQLPAARPANSALGSERGALLPSIDVALEHYLQDCRLEGAAWLAAAKHREAGQRLGGVA